LPAPARPPRFRGAARCSAARRPPPLAWWVHPLEAVPLLQSSPVRTRPRPLGRGHLPWGSVPLRDVNLRSPRSRASQARFVPPSAFLTPSTVCSSAGLAGLFHPAAASGIRPSGVFPPSQPYHLISGRCPRVVRPRPLPPACAGGARDAAPPSGPCSAPESVVKAQGFSPRLTRSPPGLHLLRVLRPPAVRLPSQPFRS
jgi:hypothetical protein